MTAVIHGRRGGRSAQGPHRGLNGLAAAHLGGVFKLVGAIKAVRRGIQRLELFVADAGQITQRASLSKVRGNAFGDGDQVFASKALSVDWMGAHGADLSIKFC